MAKAVNWRELVTLQLFERDKSWCALCGLLIHEDELFEIDHIIEKKNGGDDSLY